MGSTGTTAIHRVVLCPSCGEIYDTRDRVGEILRNSGYCVNLTCLEDLSDQPLSEVFRRPAREADPGDRRRN